MSKKEVILVIGALGQVGTELTVALRNKYGTAEVIAADLKLPNPDLLKNGPYCFLNVMEKLSIEYIVTRNKVTTIYHLAGVLSANGEKNISNTWNTNIQGLMNVLNVAKIFGLRLFWPSSIAVFGPSSPKALCPQHSITEPITIYGITKSAGEQLCNYYHEQYGVDVRSLRYPGLIGYMARPNGGTTDYAMEIFYEALEKRYYNCFLKEDMILPMMYMADAVRAALELMDTSSEKLKIRTAYNISAMSFSPRNLADAIREHLPDFRISFIADFRQKIADSWPRSIEYLQATNDWGWKPTYDLPAMVADMLENIGSRQYITNSK